MKSIAARRRLTGSATSLAASSSRRIVVTAEHVLAGPEAKHLGVSRNNSVRWPEKYWRLSAIDPDLPEADVAWAVADVAAEADDVVRAAIPLALALPIPPIAESASLVAVGYPASRGKLKNAHALLSAQLMSVVGKAVSARVLEDLKLDPRVHLGMLYEQAACVDLDGNPSVGAHPKGMSGGAMFLALSETPS